MSAPTKAAPMARSWTCSAASARAAMHGSRFCRSRRPTAEAINATIVMALRAITWIVSFGVHAAFTLFMLMTTGGASYEQGAGEDVMVVEQGIAIEGFAKLGEDFVTVEEVL